MKRPSPHARPGLLLLPALFLTAAIAWPATSRVDGAGSAEAPAAALSLEAAAERLVELSRGDNQVQQHLWHLTREIGPRLTGSSNLQIASSWALRRFEELGLEARMEEWGAFPVGFDRGPWSGGVVGEEPLEFITPAWSPGTRGNVRARAVLQPDTAEAVERMGRKLEGVWLVRDDAGLDRDLRESIRRAVAQHRIAGVVQPGPTSNLLVMGGSHRITWDNLPTDVRITVRHDQHQALVERLRAGEKLELEFDIQNRFVQGPIPQYNVVADLVGSERPNEFVIVQAHLDSWDGAEGTCDNGTGVSTTLEAARLLVESGLRPRRTIRFVLYSGEEQGLFGSRAYVQMHAGEMERTSIVLNHDNGTNPLAGIQATRRMLPAFERVFAPVQGLDPQRPFEIRLVDGIRPGPSDHAPFVEAGVPAFHWIQSAEGYRHIHHTQHDRFEMANAQDQEHSALVIAIAAHGFAALEELVERTDMSAPEPRRMGVFLEGNAVQRVIPDSRAARAGWQPGDVILAVDGVAPGEGSSLQELLQRGGPIKTLRVRRGAEELDTVLDWSDEADEPRRLERQRGPQGGGDGAQAPPRRERRGTRRGGGEAGQDAAAVELVGSA
jgi:carboxypeptidase Q